MRWTHFTRRAALILAVLAAAANVYRAATQDITVDEATTYNDFASLPFWWMWRVYEANHHVLHTILCHLSTSVLPLSAFSLRLPSLLGGIFYLWAAYRVCALVCPRPPVFLSTYALLALNPFLLDYLSAARGYGLASAFWMASVYCALGLLRQMEDSPARRAMLLASLCAGLSVASNLSFAFAAVPELLVLGALLGMRRNARHLPALAASLLAPAAAVFALIDLPPLLHNRSPFILGAASVRASFESVAGHVLFYSTGKFDVAGILADPSPGELWILGIARWGAIASGLAAASFLLLSLRSARATVPEAHRFALFLGGQLALSMVCLAAAHSMFGVLYPVARSGLYFMLLVPLLCAALARCAANPPWAALGRVYVFAAGALALWFLTAIQLSSYSEWRFNRNTLELFHRLQDAAKRENRSQARVGATYLLAPPLEFYRRALRDKWLAPVESFNGAALAARARLNQFDYFAVLPQDDSIAREFAPRRLWTDPTTGVFLYAAAGANSGPAVPAPAPVPAGCVDDDDGRLRFAGPWQHERRFPEAYGGTISYSNSRGASFEFSFSGRGVVYVFTKAFNRGNSAISLDGVAYPVLDPYASVTAWRSQVYLEAPRAGAHVLTVTVLGTKNAASQDAFVDVDCLAPEP